MSTLSQFFSSRGSGGGGGGQGGAQGGAQGLGRQAVKASSSLSGLTKEFS